MTQEIAVITLFLVQVFHRTTLYLNLHSMASKLTQNLTEATVLDSANDKVPIFSAASPYELRYMTPANLAPTISDASTTLKGKVELATDAETITGTDTVRVVTPSNITGKMDTDGTLTGNSDTRIPSQKAVKTYADTKTTLSTVLSTIASGWTSISATLTFSSADAPTYVCTTSSDLTGSIGVGMRIKLTHSASTKYFIVTAIDAATITLYGGTDYTLAATAITAPYYSNVKAPLGFPQDTTKWTVKVTDTTQRNGAGTGTTWNNIGGANAQISVPIGIWEVDFTCEAYGDRTTAGTGDSIDACLSTANNTASDTELYGRTFISGAAANQSDVMSFVPFKQKTLALVAKTLYYLNIRMQNSGTWTMNNNVVAMVIRAKCSYL